MSGEGGEDNVRKFPRSRITQPKAELEHRQLENLLDRLDVRAKLMYRTLRDNREIRTDTTLDKKRQDLAMQDEGLPPEKFEDWIMSPEYTWLENPIAFFLIAELYLRKRNLLEDSANE